jgi:hypothetical protein
MSVWRVDGMREMKCSPKGHTFPCRVETRCALRLNHGEADVRTRRYPENRNTFLVCEIGATASGEMK